MENILSILMMMMMMVVDQWYPEACNSPGLKHILHTPFEKSIVERAIEYVKDRTENFDDYYPCRRRVVVDCNIVHVYLGFHCSYFYIICPNHNHDQTFSNS